ncbi:hypothetical protein CLV32_4070 [Pedobacter duraquae]|uniref:Uncharacterized protein n=1 Tax=Pedobacter duraquae TaxID=425511 RepID=A0A4R6IDG5_9SPHI|nr:hypothetical protein CLV32_4070 [Pedobacter duraquae]
MVINSKFSLKNSNYETDLNKKDMEPTNLESTIIFSDRINSIQPYDLMQLHRYDNMGGNAS